MFCIELFMVLMDEFIVVMIGAERVYIEAFVIDAFAVEIETGCVVR